MPCAAVEEGRLFHTPGGSPPRLCTGQARDDRGLAGMRGGLVDTHLEADHTEDRRAISMAVLCCRLRRACADGML